MPATDWEGEGAKIFRPEDLIRNDLAQKLEALMPTVPKERIQGLVDMVQKAETPNFSWVPENARGPVLHEVRKAAEAFDRIAVGKVEAEMQAETRAKAIPALRAQDEAERAQVIETFRDQFEKEKLAQNFALPPDEPKVSQRSIPTMIVKREDLQK